MQISFVMLLFSDKIIGRGKSFQEGQMSQGAPPAPLVGESQGKNFLAEFDTVWSREHNFKIL